MTPEVKVDVGKRKGSARVGARARGSGGKYSRWATIISADVGMLGNLRQVNRWRSTDASGVDCSGAWLRHPEGDLQPGNLLSDGRGGRELWHCSEYAIVGAAGSRSAPRRSEVAAYLLAIINLTAGIGSADVNDIGTKCVQHGIGPVAIVSARWVAGTRKALPRRLMTHSKCINQLWEVRLVVSNAGWCEGGFYSPPRNYGAVGDYATAISRPLVVHTSILQRASWGCRWARGRNGAGGDGGIARSRRSRWQCRQQHLQGRGCNDACGRTLATPDIDHHLMKTRPNRDGNDRVGNNCVHPARPVDRTCRTDGTGLRSSSVPPIPLPHERWRQDEYPQTCDPTARGGMEDMHRARRRGEAPSKTFDCHSVDLNPDDKAEGEGGYDDPTATNITIRDGDCLLCWRRRRWEL